MGLCAVNGHTRAAGSCTSSSAGHPPPSPPPHTHTHGLQYASLLSLHVMGSLAHVAAAMCMHQRPPYEPGPALLLFRRAGTQPYTHAPPPPPPTPAPTPSPQTPFTRQSYSPLPVVDPRFGCVLAHLLPLVPLARRLLAAVLIDTRCSTGAAAGPPLGLGPRHAEKLLRLGKCALRAARSLMMRQTLLQARAEVGSTNAPRRRHARLPHRFRH